MTAGAGDERAPATAGLGHLRASHADREQVIGMLKAAFVQGRLTKNEFDLRVGQAFASRTQAELAVLTGDLPAGLTDIQPPRIALLLSSVSSFMTGAVIPLDGGQVIPHA